MSFHHLQIVKTADQMHPCSALHIAASVVLASESGFFLSFLVLDIEPRIFVRNYILNPLFVLRRGLTKLSREGLNLKFASLDLLCAEIIHTHYLK